MKPENLVHAIGHIDTDLVERAENRSTIQITDTAKYHKRITKRFAACAACLALTMVVGVSAAFATGFVDTLLAYFSGETDLYLEEILSTVTSVSNEDMELRIDGAIADEHTCHMIVSFIGLTDESQSRFAAGDLDVQEEFDTYAVLSNGERVDIYTHESATYIETSDLGKKAKTMFADADMTYVISCILDDGISMNDVDTLCFAYEGLVLELDVQKYISPEYELHAETSDGTERITDFHVSRIGFYFTSIVNENFDDFFDIKLIYADGTVCEFTGRDLGYQLSYGHNTGDETVHVSGRWGGTSVVSVGIIDLDDYCGIQVNGVDYYFTN